LHTETIERLCHDRKTIDEATRLFLIARANTGAGSGFDLGEDRTGLAAVCAYLASQNLNNTNVTFDAAQIASCQSKPKFKKLIEQVGKALAARKPARQTPLAYGPLIREHCSHISLQAIPLMDQVEVLLLEKLDESNTSSDDEITCAVFIWVCNVIEGRRLFHPNSFEDKYETDATHMRQLSKLIKSTCGHLEAKILADYNKPVSPAKSASASPRKSPSKPALRALPSRDSPQKRKVTFPDDGDDANAPESPTKRPKIAQSAAASSSLVTLDSIRKTRSMSSSPTKTLSAPSTPRKVQRMTPSSPSKSPSKPQAATPARTAKLVPLAVDDALCSSDEEDYEPALRRRFRPVFRDQAQWAMCDPRLAELARAAAEYSKRMIKQHGLPFQDH
ncbi:hypothetical protein C8R44DRAFT_540279, partial [Mycena epipterygia]